MNDFDFLFGSWHVDNRRLRTLFAGSDDWYTFPGACTARPILGGTGNIDEIDFPTQGFSGFTVRLFDRDRSTWSIFWASSRTGTLEPPVVGTFRDGRGDFYGDDTFAGRPIRAHFIWSHVTATSARWEQEFSADGGATWESNWVMELTRR
ncbi:hypothetical protein [Dactylosporangium matsuzakiense]|uniref:DUF1579 domain-containing protein n=1 Tax=Dactylosporangium matsuzakiense TaxID=53360 RepID=A0A9W6KRH0_9ACTN|nr:hypothetical protein [Dactylosporangium matsuzakiense]UWZ49168.1 hypothetical protein Dmats_23895 [Dactylosporangium matsuzakiense]GLL06767.1 hypothetical protein GCM10017581_085170 [Dactylosporangium matsuzakiense]